jgi:hypothetical protein
MRLNLMVLRSVPGVQLIRCDMIQELLMSRLVGGYFPG